jgi:hypothetical protein
VQSTDFIYNPGLHNVISNIPTNTIPPPPPPLPGMFIQPNLAQVNPALIPYLKMLKLGIPRDAVKQKMMLTGDDPTLLDGPISGPPPPFLCGIPPPLQPFLGGIVKTIPQQNTGPPKITSDMLATVRLKKADSDAQEQQPRKQQQQPRKQQQQQGFKVDLADILSMKSRLKSRTPTDDDKDSYSKIFKKE